MADYDFKHLSSSLVNLPAINIMIDMQGSRGVSDLRTTCMLNRDVKDIKNTDKKEGELESAGMGLAGKGVSNGEICLAVLPRVAENLKDPPKNKDGFDRSAPLGPYAANLLGTEVDGTKPYEKLGWTPEQAGSVGLNLRYHELKVSNANLEKVTIPVPSKAPLDNNITIDNPVKNTAVFATPGVAFDAGYTTMLKHYEKTGDTGLVMLTGPLYTPTDVVKFAKICYNPLPVAAGQIPEQSVSGIPVKLKHCLQAGLSAAAYDIGKMQKKVSTASK